METIQNILIDSLNGFSAKDVPLFFFQILSAGFMAHLIQAIINRKFKEKILSTGGLTGTAVAVLAGIVKYSLPFSVLGAAIILLLLNKKDRRKIEITGLFLFTSIGIGCGVGSVIQTALGFVVIGLVLLFMPLNDQNEM